MHRQEITAEIRTATGKGVARQLRLAGMIPAVLYGGGQECTPLTVSPDAIELLRRSPLGLNTPIDLNVDGMAGTRLVMVKDVQQHPISRQVLHVDFLVVDAEQPVLVQIRVDAVGRSIGIQAGGRLNVMRRYIDVRCLPSAIPETIEVDITEYDVGSKLFVDELVLPKGVEAIYEQRYPLFGISTKGAQAALDEFEVEEEEEEVGDEEDAEGAGESEDTDRAGRE